MKFVVEESKWLRGKDDGKLLTSSGSHGKMCCLGFVCRQSGVKKDIVDVGMPGEVKDIVKTNLPKWLIVEKPFFYKEGYFTDDTPDCQKLSEINDNKKISDSERKKQIKEIFRKNGDTIVFVK